MKQQRDENFYDLFDDWELIESSFAQQYNIRLRNETKMQWSEFCSLLQGLNTDTPFGHVVNVRSTTDEEMLKNMSASDKKIRSDWQYKQCKKPINKDDYIKSMKALEEAMKALAN